MAEEITLVIRSEADRSVGIFSDEIAIKLWKGHIDGAENREDVRTIFCNAAKEFWDMPIESAFFSDECPDCGKLTSFGDCQNKHCIANLPDDEWEFENNV